MKACIGKVDITPQEPCYLCGQAIRTELSTGILDPLYVTILMLKTNDEVVVFLSFDLTEMDKELVEMIKQVLVEEISCDRKNIIVSYTHTHSAPEVGLVGFLGDPEKGTRPGYRDFLTDKTRACVRQISQKWEEVSIYYSSAVIEGCYGNRNYKDKSCDKSMNFISFEKTDGEKLGLMVNMSCHPTVLGASNYMISADIFGAIRTSLSHNHNCEVLMMQGASGDMGNRQYRQGEDQKELFRLRDGILSQLHELQWEKIDGSSFQIADTKYVMDYMLDLKQFEARLNENTSKLERETDITQIRLLRSGIMVLENMIKKGEHVHMELNGKIVIISKIIIVCVPCEMFNQLGMKIKHAFPDYEVIIWGYCEDYIGYLAESSEYGKNYETIATQIKEGEPEKYTDYLIDAIKNTSERYFAADFGRRPG